MHLKSLVFETVNVVTVVLHPVASHFIAICLTMSLHNLLVPFICKVGCFCWRWIHDIAFQTHLLVKICFLRIIITWKFKEFYWTHCLSASSLCLVLSRNSQLPSLVNSRRFYSSIPAPEKSYATTVSVMPHFVQKKLEKLKVEDFLKSSKSMIYWMLSTFQKKNNYFEWL